MLLRGDLCDIFREEQVVMMRYIALMLLVGTFAAAAELPRIPALNWQERSDWVNVKSDVTPCAAGDGVADDTDALQAALDMLNDTRGPELCKVVYLPPGTYRVTRTLVGQRTHGGALIGHGRDTRIMWDGPAVARLYWSNGATYHRYVGITWDGAGRAAVGVDHDSKIYYETHMMHQHCAFLNFTEGAIRVGHDQKLATAETLVENCLFYNCGTGITLLSYNDYNWTIDGCEFVDCGMGINSVKGEFVLRNSRFLRSRAVDVRQLNPSHASSVRRVISIGSRRFLETGRGLHQALTLQDCHVYAWTDQEGAVMLGHRGPTTVFDCTFSDPPGRTAPIRLVNPAGAQQLLIVSNNESQHTDAVVDPGANSRITEIPPGERGPALKGVNRTFIRSEAPVPGKVFDAKEDFGAKGDGAADDTEALRRAVNAARERGQGAIAYLPTGTYRITGTIPIEGANYYVGSTGFQTQLRWDGPADGVALDLKDPQNVTLEHFAIWAGNVSDPKRLDEAVEKWKDFVSIRQTSAGGPSLITVEDVYTNYDYHLRNFIGWKMVDLPEEATVRARYVIGLLHSVNSSRATVLVNLNYGRVVVEGALRPKTGILAFLTHVDHPNPTGLVVRDNQDLIASDWYVEQNTHYVVQLEGGDAGAPGRVTIGGRRLHNWPEEWAAVRGYQGRLFIGGGDVSKFEDPLTKFTHTGESPVWLILAGNQFQRQEPIFDLGTGGRLVLVENNLIDQARDMPQSMENRLPEGAMKALAAALDDFRELGELDLRLNHPLP